MHPTNHTHHIPHNMGTNPTPSSERHAATHAGGTAPGDATDRAESRTKGLAGSEADRGAADLPGHAAGHASALYAQLKNNFEAHYRTDDPSEFSNWMAGRLWTRGSMGFWLVWAMELDGVACLLDEGEVVELAQGPEWVLLDPALPEGPERTLMLSRLPQGWVPHAALTMPPSGEVERAHTIAMEEPDNVVVFAFYERHKDLRLAVLGSDVAGSAATLEQMEALRVDYLARVAGGCIVEGERYPPVEAVSTGGEETVAPENTPE